MTSRRLVHAELPRCPQTPAEAEQRSVSSARPAAPGSVVGLFSPTGLPATITADWRSTMRPRRASRLQPHWRTMRFQPGTRSSSGTRTSAPSKARTARPGPDPERLQGRRGSACSAEIRRVIDAGAISDLRTGRRVKKWLEYLIKASYLGFCFRPTRRRDGQFQHISPTRDTAPGSVWTSGSSCDTPRWSRRPRSPAQLDLAIDRSIKESFMS